MLAPLEGQTLPAVLGRSDLSVLNGLQGIDQGNVGRQRSSLPQCGQLLTVSRVAMPQVSQKQNGSTRPD